jgi:hypothetical protein
MYGLNVYDLISEDKKERMLLNKKETMEKTWNFKRMIINNNMKIHCITLDTYYLTLNEASINVYSNNRNVRGIINSIENKEYKWELTKNE